ncbi:hypothetical protein KVR01_008398 [Diaporthe batatas]|uniref:uncharacterized protein n=1 Tax=Diaporthe batatas TaxID=748121 RepID=UPI001D04A98C|nr:uncharacterized protein KVR01_008398 [Diaporthe batatas]KAG8161411.1 hypothetical protein KVR01_008398 [Diaporthe batatas]
MNSNFLTSTLGSIASTPHLLLVLRSVVSVVLLFLSGISFCIRFWCIPMLRRCPPSPTQVSQFSVIIEQGHAILLRTSRALAVALMSLTLLTAAHPDPGVAGLWRWHGFCVVILVAMGAWEKRALFPVNDRILAFDHDVGIGEGKGRKGDGEFTVGEKGELKGLLDIWAARHPWRIVVPLTCGLITFGVTVSQTA